MDRIVFEYQFRFSDETERRFVVSIDPETMVMQHDEKATPPDWAKLENQKCSHCPYSQGEVPYCPVARNIAQVAEAFKEEASYRPVTVFVRTEGRFYGKMTDVQTGLQALFGLVMASSECTHMDIFKPTARFHLPFSSFEETVVRIIGAHLIGEFLKKSRGESTNIDLEDLVQGYANVSIVNRGMISRIRTLGKTETKKAGDAHKNGLIILDGFASLLPMELQSGLETLMRLFAPPKKAPGSPKSKAS